MIVNGVGDILKRELHMVLPLNKILCGNCFEIMKDFPEASIDSIVTSPPYWGLRDYGTGEDQLGLEPHPQLYIDNIVDICREIKRILKSSGTFWLNIGDTYYGGPPEYQPKDAKGLKRKLYYQKICERCGESFLGDHKRRFCSAACGGSWNKKRVGWLQPKQKLMISSRVAIALQNDGWILRSDIIWHKPNHLPSPVKDRLTNSYEHVFLFAKKRQYYFDLDSIRVPHQTVPERRSKRHPLQEEVLGPYASNRGGLHKEDVDSYYPKGKNPGDLWIIPTAPFPGAHFAVFPLKLIEPIIKAGCPEKGIVLDPFAGSGTVGKVARRLGRKFILIEINPEYCKMAEQRIRGKYKPVPEGVEPLQLR